MSGLKSVIKRFLKYEKVLSLYNTLYPHNRFKLGRGNSIVLNAALLNGVTVQIQGTNNSILFGKHSRLNNCTIKIFGDNNIILIGEACLINHGIFWIEDDGNVIHVQDRTTVNGKTEFAVIEGTSIIVGEDCMFSSNITLRTGDSHSILDAEGNRINPSENIQIGNHVWIGAEVVCLKGTTISDNSIIGTKSLIHSKFNEPNVTIAGLPAKVVKRSISWKRERI